MHSTWAGNKFTINARCQHKYYCSFYCQYYGYDEKDVFLEKGGNKYRVHSDSFYFSPVYHQLCTSEIRV